MTESRKRTEELKISEGTPGSEQGNMAEMVRSMLTMIGEDPQREGLRHTPERFERALRYLTSGYRQDPQKILNNAMFSVGYDQMVVVKDIELFSLCEHHMLPFLGRCHVAYLPDKKVVGLSKIPRLVNMFSRRLQIQERLTSQIAEAIQNSIQPLGVGVVIEARHLCMIMRGVEKQRSEAVTSAMLGAFRENLQTREEFLSLISRRGL
jgi:GTP cyclohydrolase IA